MSSDIAIKVENLSKSYQIYQPPSLRNDTGAQQSKPNYYRYPSLRGSKADEAIHAIVTMKGVVSLV